MRGPGAGGPVRVDAGAQAVEVGPGVHVALVGPGVRRGEVEFVAAEVRLVLGAGDVGLPVRPVELRPEQAQGVVPGVAPGGHQTVPGDAGHPVRLGQVLAHADLAGHLLPALQEVLGCLAGGFPLGHRVLDGPAHRLLRPLVDAPDPVRELEAVGRGELADEAHGLVGDPGRGGAGGRFGEGQGAQLGGPGQGLVQQLLLGLRQRLQALLGLGEEVLEHLGPEGVVAVGVVADGAPEVLRGPAVDAVQVGEDLAVQLVHPPLGLPGCLPDRGPDLFPVAGGQGHGLGGRLGLAGGMDAGLDGLALVARVLQDRVGRVHAAPALGYGPVLRRRGRIAHGPGHGLSSARSRP